MNVLAVMKDGRWEPGIGDPSVMGWVTVAAYLLTAAWCAAHARRRSGTAAGRRPDSDAPRGLWLCFALILLALGINKQLDLQSWFTVTARDIVKSQGWYEQRRTLQAVFIAAVAATGLTVAALLAWALRRVWRRHLLALIGMTVLLVFVVIRAASFHGVDNRLGWRLAGLKINWLFELGGITLIALSLWRDRRRSRRAPPPDDPSLFATLVSRPPPDR